MSFYQFLKTLHGAEFSEEQQVITEIINDIAFPKLSTSYEEIASYLEDNAYYISNMDLFDQLWEKYEQKG